MPRLEGLWIELVMIQAGEQFLTGVAIEQA
jgi:hypothetical protein